MKAQIKTITKVVIIFGFLFSLGACSDFLDQVPEEKLSEANLFKSKDDVVKVLTQIYSYYKPTIEFNDNCGLAADEADYNWSNYGPHYKDVGQYSQSSLIYNHWSDFYKQINTSLYFLSRIDECQDEKLTEDERSWWRGEAYFLEAYYYFLLLQQYGPIPLIDKVYSGDELTAMMAEGVPRSHFDDCVQFIDDLLVNAIAHLDLFYTFSSTERAARASQCSAWFLRSRLWLYAASPLYNGMTDAAGKSYSFLMPKDMDGHELINASFDNNKWKKAMEITEEAIEICQSANLGLYKPGVTASVANGYTAYWNVFNYARGGHPSSENVFYKQNFSTGSIRNHALPISWSGYTGICPTLEHVNEYFMANGLMPEDDPEYRTASGFTTYTKNNNTIRLYNKYKKRDPRFYVNILFPGQYSYAVLGNENESYDTRWAYNTTTSWTDYIWYRPFFDGPDGYESKTGRDFTTTGFLSVKFVGKTDNRTSKGDYAVNIFRYAELYLNYTEAAFEYYTNSGADPASQAEVFRYWDELRERIQIPDVRTAYTNAGIPLTTAKLRELIRRERKIEMAFEGHRYFDNRRWLIAEKEGGDKHGMDVYKTEAEGFWNENFVFEERFWHDKMYFMPIPQSEIDKNPKLTQNALWAAE
ncbi:RagB/SusD family nutrient uptake outer membrane protein [Gaoshiqia sp. Z1-71]|uniref:RagB/SusD family nutrient uptake outer membrane protein n=1 Tax=Gaoshiqia hydrogeniformans TaxID=3290090 RepID=UPI003BF86D61